MAARLHVVSCAELPPDLCMADLRAYWTVIVPIMFGWIVQ